MTHRSFLTRTEVTCATNSLFTKTNVATNPTKPNKMVHVTIVTDLDTEIITITHIDAPITVHETRITVQIRPKFQINIQKGFVLIFTVHIYCKPMSATEGPGPDPKHSVVIKEIKQLEKDKYITIQVMKAKNT